MKKVMTCVLIIVLALALVACGGKDSDTPSSSAPAQNTQSSSGGSGSNGGGNDASGDVSDDEILEIYLDAMGGFINGFDQLMDSLGQLMDYADNISSDDELIEWCYWFIEIKDAVGEAADDLADIASDVPANYQESHLKVTFSVAAVYDSMSGFEYAVDAALEGDEDAFIDGVSVFLGNLMAAAELWMEAVEY